MIKRYISRAVGEGPFQDTTPDERVRAWTKTFAPNAARRMTRLGLMLGAAMRDFPIGPDDAVVYATTFAETVATERYLDSFPAASPLLFQTSIHPSAIEQVLINRVCPVRELTPLAGQRHLAAQAALTALLTPGPRVLLTGGEEVGTWLRELSAASNVGYAFALDLVASGEEAIGELCWRRDSAPDVSLPDTDSRASSGLEEMFNAVREHQPLRLPVPAGGEISLRWL